MKGRHGMMYDLSQIKHSQKSYTDHLLPTQKAQNLKQYHTALRTKNIRISKHMIYSTRSTLKQS